MKTFFSLLMTTLFTTPLFASNVTNADLLKMCKDKSETSQNFCFGYIVSTANAAQFYRNIVDIEDEYIDICFPEDISNKEIVDLYMDWVQKNPSVLSSPAFIGVSTSFSKKYSCPANTNKKKTNAISEL